MTGDQNDFIARIRATLPRWFGDVPQVITAVLTGLAMAWAGVYSLYSYAAQQARIRTASGVWLDLAAADFFGTSLPRQSGEQDTPYRLRILAALLQECGTRLAITKALIQITGRTPLIFEPMRPADTGGYRLAVGYGAAGAYGSMSMPYQALVTAYRQASAGIPLVAGYGISAGAYRTPSRSNYANIGSIQQVVSDASIYAAIDAAKPAGTQVWVKISN